MKRFLIKSNLELLTVLLFALVTAAAVFTPSPSVEQRILMVYAFLYTLHEWEETRYPGGFSNIMESMLGRKFDDDAKELSHIPVMVLLLVIHIVPYIFDSVLFLTLIPVFLGIFEGFVHTMGVKLSRAKKFYTPGMVTAYMLLVFSIFNICCFSVRGILTGKDCVLGFVCMFVCFAVMQNRVLAINGVAYKDMFNMIKSRIKSKKASV